MFLDSLIVLIADDAVAEKSTLQNLGIPGVNSNFTEEDFTTNPIRLRIDDIKYVYKSLFDGILVIELYDTDGNFMLKDDISRVKKKMDEHYNKI